MSMETERMSHYNDHSETVEISQEDRIIGPKISALFRNRLARQPRWHIKKGVVTIIDTGERIAVDVSKEQISEPLARLFTGFQMVENRLPDYMGEGNRLVRNNVGLFEVNMQWGREELNHGLALGEILVQTGYKTQKQIDEERIQNLTKTWQLPFPSAREIVAHFVFTEIGTYLAYRALEKKAKEEGAIEIAKILNLIGDDERYHAFGYREITGIYYEADPEGTIEDVLHVAENFKMPAENLHPNQRQWALDLARVRSLSKDFVVEQILYSTLKNFGFISEELARKTADEFFKKQK